MKKVYSDEDIALIFDEVKRAIERGDTITSGLSRAAEELGKTTKQISSQYYYQLEKKKENRSAMYAPPRKVNFVPEDWQLDSVMQEKLDAVSGIYEFIKQIWQENLELKAQLKQYKQDRDEIRAFMIERLGIDRREFKFAMDNDCVVQELEEVE